MTSTHLVIMAILSLAFLLFPRKRSEKRLSKTHQNASNMSWAHFSTRSDPNGTKAKSEAEAAKRHQASKG